MFPLLGERARVRVRRCTLINPRSLEQTSERPSGTVKAGYSRLNKLLL